MQATVLLEKLKKFKFEQKLRIKIAKLYNNAFKLNKNINTQKIQDYSLSTFSVFSIEFRNRKLKNQIINKFKKNKIGYNIYYKRPMHLEKVFFNLGLKKKSFLNSENLSKNIISIPIDPYMKLSQVKKVIEIINE